jgi:hypothetical protein
MKSKPVTAPPAAETSQHPIHQPTLTKALLNDLTPARPLFEGLGPDAGHGFTCGAASGTLMNLNPAMASPS